MKKILTVILTSILLVLLNEVTLCRETRTSHNLGAIVGCSLIVRYFSNNTNIGRQLVITAFAAFLLSWLLGAANIVIDHYLYFLPTGLEDGAPLTLGLNLRNLMMIYF